MTEMPRCRWCRRVLPEQKGPGRPRVFCSQRCRQWDWVSRQRAADLDLAENELVIGRDELDGLHDDLYVLACAIDDAESDVKSAGARPAVRDLQEIIENLFVAAKPLRNRELSAPAVSPTNSS